MNYSMIRYVCCKVLMLTSLLMILPLIVAIIYREQECAMVFLVVLVCSHIVGAIGARFKPKKKIIYAREGFVATALAWVVISAVGAVPYLLTGAAPTYVDAMFETVSGFTTTGASIMTDIDHLPYSINFWRTFTHWIGGMGVLVFMLAVMPLADGYSMHLMRAESPGPVVGKFVPKVKDTAKILYLMYIAFTVTEMIALKISGLSVYEAMTLTFSTVGTGGFGLSASNISGYSMVSQSIITVFMILCGVNFSVYYFLLTKKFREAWHTDEMRWYLLTIFVASSVIAINIYRAGIVSGAYEAFHHSIFTVASIMTTTGFGTLDFNQWPLFSKSIIAVLTLVGACAGSTGGGFKVSRVIILFKTIKNELDYVVHPHLVKKVTMDDHVVEGSTVKSVHAYLAFYVGIFIASFIVVSLDNFDFETTISAIAATLNNVGPGFGMVGPYGSFAEFSAVSKIVMMFDMLAGRLELLPILIMIRKTTWKR